MRECVIKLMKTTSFILNMAKGPKLLCPTEDELSLVPPLLPHDLILLILFRVPVKSLLRFKCVSKSWKTLISDPQLAKDHIRASTTDPNMIHQRLVSSIINYDDSNIASLPMQSLFQNPSTTTPEYFKISGQFRILGSCNGLLCLGDIHQRYVILWNPYINLKSRTLPFGVGNCERFTHYGFGYDYANDKYKLLVAVRNRQETVTKIYTFGAADCWTVIMNFPLPYIYESYWSGKFVSNSLNWMANKSLSVYQWVILSFELATETYGEVLLPRGDGGKIRNPKLDVLRDCLCVTFFDYKKACWVVWLMKEYGVQDSWTILVMIPDFCGGFQQLRPLCILENGIFLLKNVFSSLILYNSNDGSLSYPRIGGNLGFRMQIYYESLVSLPC